MKITIFIINFLLFFLICTDVYAVGSVIAAAIGLSGFAATAVAFAINMVVSTVVSKVFAPKPPSLGDQTNPGSKQQLPPSGSNKLPVIYGNAWTGGIVTDLTISKDNQNIYWVIALCEVTNTESGVSAGSPDDINFGEIYWGINWCLTPINMTPINIRRGSCQKQLSRLCHTPSMRLCHRPHSAG